MINSEQLALSSLVFMSLSAIYATAATTAPPIPETLGMPIVDLGYSVYQGQTLSNGVNEWLGIRFAAPPVRNLRFRKPAPPQNTTGVIQASSFGPVCFGLTNGDSSEFSEDCLFLNLWGPSNITQSSRFPVFFWLSGGGFQRDVNANYNGSALVEAADLDMIYIGINYRAGPFGFLANEEVSKTGELDLNVGLHDQLFALRWIQRHIQNFGGDPGRVVIVGDSAGAGSIAIHLVTRYSKPETLFHGIFGLSPFFPTQFFPADLQFQFDLFANRVGCGGFNTSSEKLACLRSQDSDGLQAGNEVSFPYPGRTNSAIVPYTPCIDNDLLTDFPLKLFAQGKYRKLPSVFGHVNNEGSLFAVNANNTEEIANFFMDNFPQLNSTDTDNIIAHYPLEPLVPQHGPWFPSASKAYGDTVLACPALALSSYLAPFADTWNYRYDVNTPSQEAAGLDVYHESDLPPLYGQDNAPLATNPGPQVCVCVCVNPLSPGGRSPIGPQVFNITPILQRYYTNFVRFLNPDLPNGSVNRTWPQWKPPQLVGTTGIRLKFSLDPSQNFAPVTGTEQASKEQLNICAFWRTLENKMGQ